MTLFVWLLVGFFQPDAGAVERAVKLAEVSGRVMVLGESDAERLRPPQSVPPGVAPVLSFRYMEGARKHRFGDSDLMVDDAGH